jgi:hypothetical protein
METYKIVRMFMRGSRRTIKRELLLQEAQQHCKDPETSSRTCKLSRNVKRTKMHGPWFDGFTKE